MDAKHLQSKVLDTSAVSVQTMTSVKNVKQKSNILIQCSRFVDLNKHLHSFHVSTKMLNKLKTHKWVQAKWAKIAKLLKTPVPREDQRDIQIRKLFTVLDSWKRTLETDMKFTQVKFFLNHGLSETMVLKNGQRMLSLSKPMVMNLEPFLNWSKDQLNQVMK